MYGLGRSLSTPGLVAQYGKSSREFNTAFFFTAICYALSVRLERF